jgi:hypothetical protein
MPICLGYVIPSERMLHSSSNQVQQAVLLDQLRTLGPEAYFRRAEDAAEGIRVTGVTSAELRLLLAFVIF